MGAFIARGLSLMGIRWHNSRMPPENAITVKEAAIESGKTEMAIRKMIDRKQIVGKKISGIWFIDRSELDKIRSGKRGRPKKITTE